MLDIKRREFIALVGGGGLLLVAKVRRVRAQQATRPVVGFFDSRSPDVLRPVLENADANFTHLPQPEA
jgi:hypothetical protein